MSNLTKKDEHRDGEPGIKAPADCRVIRWIAYDDSGAYPESIGGMGGWVKGSGWDEYIDAIKEEYRPYYEALRKSIIELDIRRGGFWHQQSGEGVPQFNDQTIGSFSMRAWGDLMASIWNTEDKLGDGNEGGYHYTHFAWYTEAEEDQR